MITRCAFTQALRFCPLALAAGVVLVSSATAACSNPTEPTPTESVEIVFRGLVSVRPDLPAFALDCAAGVLVTRVHPSWRNYVAVPMSAVLPGIGGETVERWQFTFHDVPVDQTVQFRINDKNWCDQNTTGAVLRDVSANGVALTQNTTTPGPLGNEPGFAFTVDASGQVRQ